MTDGLVVREGTRFPLSNGEVWITFAQEFGGRWWCRSEDRRYQSIYTTKQIKAAITKAAESQRGVDQ